MRTMRAPSIRRLGLAVGAVALAAVSTGPASGAETVRLTLGHRVAPEAPAHMLLLKPWAQRLPILSAGRLSVSLAPAAGAEVDLMARLRAGEIDLAWLPVGEALGPGAAVEVFELPFMAWPAEATSQAAMALHAAHGAAPGSGVRVLLVHAEAPAALHARGAPLRTLDDLRGRRIQAGSRALRAFLEAAGAEPMGPPGPAPLHDLLAQGRLDGAALSFAEAAPGGTIEATRFHTLAGRPPDDQTPRRPGLGTVLHALVIGAARFADLDEELRRVLVESAGPALAQTSGRTWDGLERLNRRQAHDRGHVFYTLPQAEWRRWRRLGESVTAQWIAEAEAKGLDGAALVRAARRLVAHYHALMDEPAQARTRPARDKGG